MDLHKAAKRWAAAWIAALFSVALLGLPALGQTTLIHWEHEGPEFEAWIAERAEIFYERTGIRVESTFINWGQLGERLTVAIAGGAAPDTSLMGTQHLPDVAASVVDLRPYIARDGVDLSQYPGPVIDNVTGPGGSIIGLPVSLWALSAAYNVEVFNELGLSKPVDWTWDDLLLYTRLTTLDVNGDGVLERWGLTLPSRFERWAIVLHHGGGAWADNYDNPTVSRATAPETLRAAQFIDELYQAGASPEFTKFREGMAGMSYSAGPNYAEQAQQMSGGFELEWIRFAKGPSANTGTELSVQPYRILRGSSNEEAGWAWIKFLANEMESQVSYGQHTGRIPAYTPAAQVHFQQQAIQYPSITVFLDLVADPTSFVRSDRLMSDGIPAFARDWLEAAYLDREVPVQSALEEIDRFINASLSR